MKKILVVDAQGGGLGRQIIIALKEAKIEAVIIATGTNSMATNNMLKAGADHVATGENAIMVCANKADIIVGPLGMVIAQSMYGEISAQMACAIGQSAAPKILIPFNNCENIVIGLKDDSMANLINSAVIQIKTILNNN